MQWTATPDDFKNKCLDNMDIISFRQFKGAYQILGSSNDTEVISDSSDIACDYTMY